MTGNPKLCSADHSKVVHKVVYIVQFIVVRSQTRTLTAKGGRGFLYLSILLIFDHDLLFMFQMCELSCSESLIDRLSCVGLILKADSHIAARLPIRIRRPINGLIFIKTDYLLLLF